MDYRVKTFVKEAVNRFGFLIDEYGFAEPEIDDDYQPLQRVFMSVAYRRGITPVVTVLAIDYGGDESVATGLTPRQATGPRQAGWLCQDTARTGYQMRRALDRHADAIRAALNSDA